MADPTNRFPACDPAKIKARRKALGLNQDQVADSAEFSQGHLSLIETGHRRPSAGKLAALAKALNCTVEDFAPAGGEAA